MKIIVIGDIHGRTIWKEIVKQNMDCDKIIFLGDYHDPYDEEFEEKDSYLTKTKSINNLLEIIQLKKENPDKIILLMGNHDAHYIYDLEFCTRFDYKNHFQLKDIFIKNKSLFQYIYKINNHLFVHAGITNNWFNLKIVQSLLKENGLKNDLSNIDEVINKVGSSNPNSQIINCIGSERGGDAPYGGITWADKSELTNFTNCSLGITNFHQYVGHNKVEKIFKVGDEKSSITFLDVLDKKININESYLKIEIDD